MHFGDRVKDTTTATGTGAITLSGTAPTGYVAFATAFSVGQVFPYVILGTSEWETGYGRLTASTTLERSIVTASSNSGSAVNFSAGTKDVFVTINAAYAEKILSRGRAEMLRVGAMLP